jgi:hypothetical protein
MSHHVRAPNGIGGWDLFLSTGSGSGVPVVRIIPIGTTRSQDTELMASVLLLALDFPGGIDAARALLLAQQGET